MAYEEEQRHAHLMVVLDGIASALRGILIQMRSDAVARQTQSRQLEVTLRNLKLEPK